MKVTLYTDPGCPFGFNAQRQELQLMWHYGEAIEIERCMIVLSERSMSFDDTPFTADMLIGGVTRLRAQYGMPMSDHVPERLARTIDACRLYVGARMYAPERSLALLRALRRLAHSEGRLLDEPSTLQAAAVEAGVDGVDAWLSDPEVEAALRADMAATRDPRPEALALAYKLSKSDGAYRYSTSSGVFSSGSRVVVAAGFQPWAVYEVAMASVAPEIARRDVPASASDVLEWAPFPLATAEVAELRGVSLDDARAELSAAGAVFTPSANDGYWSR
jgi:predicted DsbA family dithiol-disulfide isomerase